MEGSIAGKLVHTREKDENVAFAIVVVDFKTGCRIKQHFPLLALHFHRMDFPNNSDARCHSNLILPSI